ncbi:RING finger protein 141 [Eurytemora carolleeae]|uniref:RING finger protein 141 n=1 Tax=Eurytemora carolleeae TaxID=1294199 RepID=UPI000C75E565|nr:RING finger protein 141 [Eurytemora carolleeae]|eukprot:XP_023339513.1 RING finger protein 141-like [Eurytemora affinis]
MGAAQSVCQVRFKAKAHFIHTCSRSYKEIASVSYEEFLQNIQELNEISGHFLDSNGKRLVFAVKKGTDTTALWKATVRVACVKVDAESKSIDSLRLLNLKQFLAVHRSLHSQASALNLCVVPSVESCEDNSSENLTQESEEYVKVRAPGHPLSLPAFSHSMFLDEALEGTSLDECCVCLERKPDTILPCAHAYCTQCIQQWNVNHKTCPVCREKLDSADEGWVISDGPDTIDIATQIQKSLMEISQD